MQFTCEKSALSLAFSVAGRTAAQKSALTALEGILCRAENNELRFTGFNMETAITYAVEAEVDREGSCILPARLFGDIVRRLPEGPVTEANYKELTERMEEYLEEFDENGVDNLILDK